MEIMDKRMATKYAIEITRIICANPSTKLVVCKESGEQVADFIQALSDQLEEKSNAK
ncbi:MAG: hypothetical protein LKJ50_03205 [Clostridiales bacterium]|jgi:hypothetical protein|nr:hypothetical protein [Clostridiales bacterium]MCI1960950.1 hypothetical protein [Clostridiales bacterium]MCI2021391.1 hypothetical protein [Clostridiales bacterium]MCI2025774.1 hypothetical protein [Clostridiales bacterium]